MKYDGNTVKAWAGDSQWRACRADLARFKKHGYTGWGSEGFWALAFYRLQKVVRGCRPGWFWAPARLGLCVVKKLLTMLIHVDLHPDAEIGPGLIIPHGGPIRVHGETKIGADCSLHHVCTIGAGPRPGGATIGDHVWIGCHSSIIGAVTIGDGAMIAANSLVISDVPAGYTAIGVPARIFSARNFGAVWQRVCLKHDGFSAQAQEHVDGLDAVIVQPIWRTGALRPDR